MAPESKSEPTKKDTATAKTAKKGGVETLKVGDLTKGEKVIYDRLIADEGASKEKALEEILRIRGNTGPIDKATKGSKEADE